MARVWGTRAGIGHGKCPRVRMHAKLCVAVQVRSRACKARGLCAKPARDYMTFCVRACGYSVYVYARWVSTSVGVRAL